MTVPRITGVICALTLFTATAAAAQHPQARDGFWINFGLGYGTLGCQDCNTREDGLSGSLSLGGTLGDRWLLGAGTNGWTKTEDGVTLSVGTLVALVRFYPSLTSGFHLHGGLGIGRTEASTSSSGFSFSVSETGSGALFGLGWDIRVGPNMSITPFWNGFAMTSRDGDANVGQIGIGLTVH